MNFLDEIQKLLERGATIDFGCEHYDSGINCLWSVNFFREHYTSSNDDEHMCKTMWYGDNGEFGDPTESMQAAVRFANFFLDNPEQLRMMFDNGGGLHYEMKHPQYEALKNERNEFMKTLKK